VDAKRLKKKKKMLSLASFGILKFLCVLKFSVSFLANLNFMLAKKYYYLAEKKTIFSEWKINLRDIHKLSSNISTVSIFELE
jgi:hypothetical protein